VIAKPTNPDALPQGSDEWRTPGWLFAYAQRRWGPFGIDLAASAANAQCPVWVGVDGPHGVDPKGTAWCNPPFSEIEPFVLWAMQRRKERRTVLLVPANRTEQAWFQASIQHASELVWLAPRVAYVDPLADRSSPAFASMFVVFDWRRKRGPIDVDFATLTPGTAGPGLFDGGGK
jgi:phage N-6-adenine-methyltransferase